MASTTPIFMKLTLTEYISVDISHTEFIQIQEKYMESTGKILFMPKM
jgi:hypothetical protein